MGNTMATDRYAQEANDPVRTVETRDGEDEVMVTLSEDESVKPQSNPHQADAHDLEQRPEVPLQRKRAATDLEGRAAKIQRGDAPRSLAETVVELQNSMNESLRRLEEMFKPRSRQAIEFFMSEVEDVLPEDWRDDSGSIPYSKIDPIIQLFKDTNCCDTYLALRKLEHRRGYLLTTLGKSRG
ncbi:hypothetical protein VTN31DRAFT_1998 [Thermomyces dupontii]|uniref:uncharacterized protein n=1 Tax=Talaromyces thermophilus TaxID=28565 RepID=UPI0037449AB5